MQIEHTVLLFNIRLVLIKFNITPKVAFSTFVEQVMTAITFIVQVTRHDWFHLLV